jgi:hypothetical protein
MHAALELLWSAALILGGDPAGVLEMGKKGCKPAETRFVLAGSSLVLLDHFCWTCFGSVPTNLA